MSFSPPEPEAASGDTNGEISAALEVQSVSHSYGKRKALDNVSFQREACQFLRPARPQWGRQNHAVLS